MANIQPAEKTIPIIMLASVTAPIAGGAAAAYRREIESAPDPAAKRIEIEARLNAIASPFRTAEATGQDIIDPRETRALLCEFAEDAQVRLREQLGAPAMPYLP